MDRLVTEGFQAVVLDDLSSGSSENIRGSLESGRVRFIEGDVRSFDVVEAAMKEVKLVCHLAAVVSVPSSMREPQLTHEVNATGTLHLLIASRNNQVEKFVHISTCAVYGEPEYTPVDEEHQVNPISPYAASKLASEHYCVAFHQAYGLKTTILRPFNVYGSRQKDGVVAEFVQRIKKGKPPIIHGNGGQTRDFVYVKDAVDAIILALKQKGAVGKVFNVGTGKATTINELAQLLLQIYDMKLKPIYKESRIGDLRESCADIRKAEKELGYKPSFSLEEALKDF